jgi:hypothetical protein
LKQVLLKKYFSVLVMLSSFEPGYKVETRRRPYYDSRLVATWRLSNKDLSSPISKAKKYT